MKKKTFSYLPKAQEGLTVAQRALLKAKQEHESKNAGSGTEKTNKVETVAEKSNPSTAPVKKVIPSPAKPSPAKPSPAKPSPAPTVPVNKPGTKKYIDLNDFGINPLSKKGIETAVALSKRSPNLAFYCDATGCAQIASNAAEAMGTPFNRSHAWNIGNLNKVVYSNPNYNVTQSGVPLPDPQKKSNFSVLGNYPGHIVGFNRKNTKTPGDDNDSYDYADLEQYPGSRGYEHAGYILDNNYILHGTGPSSTHKAYYVIDDIADNKIGLTGYGYYDPVEVIQSTYKNKNANKNSSIVDDIFSLLKKTGGPMIPKKQNAGSYTNKPTKEFSDFYKEIKQLYPDIPDEKVLNFWEQGYIEDLTSKNPFAAITPLIPGSQSTFEQYGINEPYINQMFDENYDQPDFIKYQNELLSPKNIDRSIKTRNVTEIGVPYNSIQDPRRLVYMDQMFKNLSKQIKKDNKKLQRNSKREEDKVVLPIEESTSWRNPESAPRSGSGIYNAAMFNEELENQLRTSENVKSSEPSLKNFSMDWRGSSERLSDITSPSNDQFSAYSSASPQLQQKEDLSWIENEANSEDPYYKPATIYPQTVLPEITVTPYIDEGKYRGGAEQIIQTGTTQKPAVKKTTPPTSSTKPSGPPVATVRPSLIKPEDQTESYLKAKYNSLPPQTKKMLDQTTAELAKSRNANSKVYNKAGYYEGQQNQLRNEILRKMNFEPSVKKPTLKSGNIDVRDAALNELLNFGYQPKKRLGGYLPKAQTMGPWNPVAGNINKPFVQTFNVADESENTPNNAPFVNVDPYSRNNVDDWYTQDEAYDPLKISFDNAQKKTGILKNSFNFGKKVFDKMPSADNILLGAKGLNRLLERTPDYSSFQRNYREPGQSMTRGDWTTNQGFLQPNRMGYLDKFSTGTGSMQFGGEVEMSDDEIYQFLAAGGELEFID
jgi:hypothetical protein